MNAIASTIRRQGLLISLGLIAFVATCLAMIPASLVATIAGDGKGAISYHGVEGTLWRGRIYRLTANGALIGDVDFQLSPFSLLVLTPRTQLKVSNGAVRGEGKFAIGIGDRVSISDADFEIDLGPFAQRGVLGVAVKGEAQVIISDFQASQDGCIRAQGNVWTNVLEAPARQYRTEGFPMSGALSCYDKDFVLALAGEGAHGGADMAILVTPDFTYELTATARTAENDIANALRFFGFEDKDGALTYGSAGVLRGVGS